MQGKLYENNFLDNMSCEKVENLRKIFEWIQLHTEICHLYVQETETLEKIKLKERVDISISKGKLLLDGVLSEPFQGRKKPLIPLSGMNRFSAPVHESLTMAQHDSIPNNISNPFKAELGTLCNVKKIPMPSRTYLRKK